ncbi:MAG TPA: hypothetical protein DEF34_11425 [Desulfotomaculum sp.]|nr:MAG: hypothetical protein VR67_03195 [Peptococcaceae bacterium BRH_c8a]KJS71582.1 MAG: hypothetical protein JL56_14535 [Desulfotomaculum sp. BICA1-6]HBX24223.1 hypothetical protein [Desulfotomaculum sp.]
MRKNKIWLLAAAGLLVLALAAPTAFGAVAGDGQNAQNQQFVDQMFGWHQSWLDQAEKDGSVTPEQAKAWQEHFNYMRDFHAQNGFGQMGSMMGGGMMGNYDGVNGYGGMMGGFNNQSQTN